MNIELTIGKYEGRLTQAQNFPDLFFWRPKDLRLFWPQHLRNVWFRKEGENFIRIDALMKGDTLEVRNDKKTNSSEETKARPEARDKAKETPRNGGANG